MTRPPKQKARPLAQLRAWWKSSTILTSGVAADVINSLLEHARSAAAAIRARVAAVGDVTLAAVDVTATVFVMNGGGWFHCRHLLAEARRHLALILRGRRREPGLDEQIVDAALAAHCLDISESKTLRGRMPAYRSTPPGGRRPIWNPPGARRTSRTGSPRTTRAHRPRPGLRTGSRGSGRYPASRCATTVQSSPARWSARSCAPPPPPRGAGRTTSSRTSRRRCPSSCSPTRMPTPSTTTRSRRPDPGRRST
ncbi:hypothetical protein [Streptomyces scopuliridis]